MNTEKPLIIFLDIDGVFATMASIHQAYVNNGNRQQREDDRPFVAKAVENLNRIVRETGAKVVISSSWRITRTIDDMRRIFANNGIVCDIIDFTLNITDERYPKARRGAQIQDWLDDHPCSGYIIIDDSDDILESQKRWLVHVTGQNGFISEALTSDAIKKLKFQKGINA
jgi:predicted transcriptional regulator